jgi:twitching motility protein PilT
MNVTVDQLLMEVVRRNGSDLVLKADNHPLFRIYGDLIPYEQVPRLTGAQVKELVYSILDQKKRQAFERDLELDFAYEIPGVSRFRVNVMQQRETLTMCQRAIPFKVSTLDELNAPEVLKDFCKRPRGLVLVTGPTGCGKSTTLAAAIDYINETRSEHIVTIEDPIEFVHEDKLSLINQRELGSDTHGFQYALRAVLRQDPDVILVGEMRDLETIGLAITAAETGHLVFATLHTTDAVQTVDRIIDVFPTHQQQQIRMQLSVNLVGVVSQTLVKKADGKGRIAAWEVMSAISAIRNLIRENKTFQIESAIQTGSRYGMQTLDQNLANLVRQGIVTEDAALDKSSSANELERLIREAEAEDAAAAAAAGRRAPAAPTRR